MTADIAVSTVPPPAATVLVKPPPQIQPNPFRDQASCSSGDIVKSYTTHRRNRNAQKKAELEATQETVVEPLLRGIVKDGEPPEFDYRNCITIWARPTNAVKDLAERIQAEFVRVLNPENLAGDNSLTSPTGAVVTDPTDGPIWIMPRDCQHMSLLEITHSVSPQEVDALLTRLKPNLEQILHLNRGTTLCRPLVCFDASAVALTFVPVDSEPYTYTHLRADIFDRVRQSVPIASRYQVPSAHIALVRFMEKITDDQVTLFLDTIDRINRELEHSTLTWTVGSENGLSCRCGRIWYGGGWTEFVGNTID
ncbi:hypothetical protein D0Z00_002803 [Geotrichum galactomycetum]|uniref:Uncharacterized protein n=1 Tax=Geotrichum galactomycetum TaxID=27317 RepID=A0ACB6V3C3_9ASCO|nr:hypothetical protein D0Z00_002803 [Geotrichum candidum]